MREVLIAITLVSLPAAAALVLTFGREPLMGPDAMPDDPSLSGLAVAGSTAFRASCADCHGALAQGATSGPSLLHPVYARSSYSDAAFRAAVREGRSARLWSFGPMPAHPEIPVADIDRIIAYVRELQTASGL